MPGVQCARSLACEIEKHTSVVTTVTPVAPGIPYARESSGIKTVYINKMRLMCPPWCHFEI
jgi:hypothetical protein